MTRGEMTRFLKDAFGDCDWTFVCGLPVRGFRDAVTLWLMVLRDITYAEAIAALDEFRRLSQPGRTLAPAHVRRICGKPGNYNFTWPPPSSTRSDP